MELIKVKGRSNYAKMFVACEVEIEDNCVGVAVKREAVGFLLGYHVH